MPGLTLQLIVAAPDSPAAQAAEQPLGGGDAQLVERALAGERSAQRALYVRHAPWAGALAARLLGSRADGEDALHDAFADAFEQLHRLQTPAAFRGWLRRIVLTRVHRRLRRRRFRALFGSQPALDATLARLAAPTCSPARRAELARIDAVLARLAPGPRLCWSLRRVEGYTLPEIADATGLSLATVKRRIAVAQAALSAHIAGEGDHG